MTAESPPKVLGREMRKSGLHSWVIGFGRVAAQLLANGYVDRYEVICACGVLGRNLTAEEGIAAIERELLAIREAIPAPEGKP